MAHNGNCFKRRRDIWSYISQHREASHREIQQKLGIKSLDTVKRDLHFLEDMGYITRLEGHAKARAIQVVIPLLEAITNKKREVEHGRDTGD